MSRSSQLGAAGAPAEGSNPFHARHAIQPHGLLLVLQGPDLRIVQASANAGPMLRRPLESLLLITLRELGGGLDARVREATGATLNDELQLLHWRSGDASDAPAFEGHVHRIGPDALVLELEPAPAAVSPAEDESRGRELLQQLGTAVHRFSLCPSVEVLAECAAQTVRSLTGHDAVQVRAFDESGHAQLLAEDHADKPGLATAPGAHGHTHAHAHAHARVLAQGAEARHLRQRVRVLVDNLQPCVELVPERPPDGGCGFDLTRSRLRAPSVGCSAALSERGARAALWIAVVREGRLWGLIEGWHAEPLPLDSRRHAACDLLAEAMATRIAAIENHARAELAAHVRRLQQRLLAAAASDGDWRSALPLEARLLLQPLAASGAVLLQDGLAHHCGEAPGPADLQALQDGLAARAGPDARVHSAWWRLPDTCDVPLAVLAVPLSATRVDWMLWLRPAPPGAHADAVAWTAAERDLALAYGHALTELIAQVDAVRLLIAQRQLVKMRRAVAGAPDAVVVADADQRAVYANAAFHALAGCLPEACQSLDALAALFTDPALAQRMIRQVRVEHRAWRGELVLRRPADGTELPVAVRAEPVPSRDDSLLGTTFVFTDLRVAKRAEAARERLELALSCAVRAGGDTKPGDAATVEKDLVGALVTNASLAAMDIADGSPTPTTAPLLEEVGASTARATALLARIRHSG